VKCFLVIIVCCVLWISPANAQTCMGGLSFETARIQAGAGGEFSSNSHGFSAGASAGKNGYFGQAGVAVTSFSGFDSSEKAVVGAVGAELKLNAQRPISVCPIVGFAKEWSPPIFGGGSDSRSSFVYHVGGSVGFVAAKSGQTSIVPVVGLSFDHRSSTENSSIPLHAFSFSNSFGNVQFGAGIVFNDRFALIPSVIRPFHLDGGELAFSIFFGAKIGS
jgi:hypothetical protein